jgi:hypothetical protein
LREGKEKNIFSALTHFGRISTTAIIILYSFSSVFAYSGGSGEPNNPYQISTVADWQTLMDTPADWSLHFIMIADVNLYGIALTPVGNSTQFTGVFDGNGHTISNLTYTTTSLVYYVGLFGCTNNATIKNLGIENVYISANSRYTGRFVGLQNSGTVSNCYSAGSIASFSYSASSANTGGLVGYLNSGTISNCHSTGYVSSTLSFTPTLYFSPYAGGLVGYLSSGTISNSYSTDSVSSTSSSYIYAYAGGLVGYLSGTISNCYSTGSASSTSSSSTYAYAGGLIGYLSGTISNCYSTGFVSSFLAGGLVGRNLSGTVTASFWDKETSGQETSAGGTGMLTADMQNVNTFLNAGWDFTTPVWEICNGTNYPKLAWQIPLTGDFTCPDGVDIYDLIVFVDQWLLEELSYDIAPAGGDGIVNFLDWAVFANDWQGDTVQLSEFISQWLKPSVYNADIAPAGDGDGVVNMLDFAVFAENWLVKE